MSQRMLRGMAAGLGALVSLGSMAGCGTDGQVQKATSIKIGVTVYDQYDTFVSQMMTDFNEYAAEQEEQTGIAINVEVYNAAGSQSTQNSQVEEMLDAGCNVICVNLVDRTEPTTIIDMAEKIMCRSFSSTGNWWRRIWSAGTGSIMSGRKHSSPESCRGDCGGCVQGESGC